LESVTRAIKSLTDDTLFEGPGRKRAANHSVRKKFGLLASTVESYRAKRRCRANCRC